MAVVSAFRPKDKTGIVAVLASFLFLFTLFHSTGAIMPDQIYSIVKFYTASRNVQLPQLVM